MSSIKTHDYELPEELASLGSNDKEEKNKIEPSTLYLVATPIGNLADLSARALKVLSGVDFIAAEDTRNSAKLLACFDIHRPLISYFEHNKRQRGEEIVAKLAAGQSCALITDAGTPAISDPGEDLVRLCGERGIRVISVPGCCAAITALTLSGLPTGRFVFEGFLSTQKSERRARLDFLKTEERTMIFYEAPHKLRSTLDDMKENFGGERRIFIARELTKLHEQSVWMTIDEAIKNYEENPPKGEFVLIVDGKENKPGDSELEYTLADAIKIAEELIEGGMSSKDASREASAKTGLPRNSIYAGIK